jgi:hypothetical protein
MSRTRFSQLGLTVACVLATASSTTNAYYGPRVMLHPEGDYAAVIQSQTLNKPSRISITTLKLTDLRAQGADIDLIQSRSTDTGFQMSINGITRDVEIDSIEQLYYSTNSIKSTSSDLRFSVDRNTIFNDGDISGSSGSLPGSDSSVSTMTQREGEYNFYEMEVEWKAASAGALDFSFTSGVTAIEANVSKSVQNGGSTEILDATHKVIAVPTIGSAVRWNISRDWSLTGEATTQSLNVGSSLIGFNAKSDWRISDRVGLSAGYQIIRSEFDLGAVTTDLNQEGLFARLQIRF